MTIDVLWLGGTGFGDLPEGISDTFGRALDTNRFAFHYLRYPAAYGAPISYAESVTRGRQILIDAIRATPNRVVIGGYSQGAGICGDLAAEIAAGAHPDLEVDACALIADPSRPLGVGMPGSPMVGGYGIEGERPIFGPVHLPTWWAVAPGDPISALPQGNPLRTIADLTEWYSLSSPDAALRWGEDLITRAKTGRWQRWWSIENWRSWGGALQFAYGYLPLGGRHTTAYIAEGLCAALADVVNREVR
ncbi:PE-PPE domain-containing protein [Nocardia australiensis]|uniref:PE-PPE domain-containing protein n=1 Tax=Nocardia australiensis TaxID=2887191 RepID=UPI001D134E43|nr:PE-PPE domain-containing protein [Nocardia australiensis]